MGVTWPAINATARRMIAKQSCFFVGSAPMSKDGHINISPKGHASATFAIVDDNTVCMLDMTGSGNETLSHVKENGRLVIMFCNFEGAPCILRIWGRAEVHELGSAGFDAWFGKAFGPGTPAGAAAAEHPGFGPAARSVIVAHVYQVSSACGYGVPEMKFEKQRDSLLTWSEKQGPEGMKKYREAENGASLDGLPGFEAAAKAGGSSSAAPAPKAKTAAGGAAWGGSLAAAALRRVGPEHVLCVAAGAALGAALAGHLGQRL